MNHKELQRKFKTGCGTAKLRKAAKHKDFKADSHFKLYTSGLLLKTK